MASKYRKKFDMPEGFYKILEDYTREVLRDQPLDLIEYSYLYFKHLDEVRLKTLKEIFHTKMTFLLISLCLTNYCCYRELWINLTMRRRARTSHPRN